MSYKKIKYTLVFIMVLVFCLFPSISLAQMDDTDQLDLMAIDKYLQEQVEANHIPGMAVTIVKGDQVIFSKGYGEAARGKPVTPQTQFYIGSVSKSFTALAALQLVDQGKLDLDTPIQAYIPWFKVADPQASATITTRHLLNHTSGLSYRGDPNPELVTTSLKEEAQLLSKVRPNTAVGTQYQYYNQNYRLVGFLIEQISGQSFGEYLQSHVFSPLGMENSTSTPDKAPDLAQGYSRVFGFPLPQSQVYIPGGLPSGYLITTAEDMGQYLIAQLNNRQVDGSRLLSPEILTEMRVPPTGVDSNYAMGWMAIEDGNILVHGGALQYFQSFVALDLIDNTGIAILSNQNSIENMLFENDAIRAGVIDILSGETPYPESYAWVDWMQIGLAAVDLLNHIRLFRMLPRWIQKTASQPRLWLWIKVLVGILFPLAVMIGLPPLVKIFEGGSPSWAEPFGLMPDLTVWLLLGMGLNLLRSLIHAIKLLRNRPSQV